MNNSIEFVKDYVEKNKELILEAVTGKYVHYTIGFENLPEYIQNEKSLSTGELDNIVKNILGINNISSFTTASGCERMDMVGRDIRYFVKKSLSIIRLK